MSCDISVTLRHACNLSKGILGLNRRADHVLVMDLVTFVFVLHITTRLPPFLKSLGYLEITGPSSRVFLVFKGLKTL